MSDDFTFLVGSSGRVADVRQDEAADELKKFFELNQERVFFSRQLEVHYEDRWYHWITNRALRELIDSGLVRAEVRKLRSGGAVHLMWHKKNRYYKREATKLVGLVEEYSDPNIGASLGLQGEALVLEGFARAQFVMRGGDVQSFWDRRWTESDHDLDFVFERDGRAYGIEVKNTLRYIEYDEFKTKIKLCKTVGVSPVFAVRMLPRSWVYELIAEGGFALIMKYQLYPWSHRELARRVRAQLGLPVDSPRRLEDGTMERFIRWHGGRM